MAHSHLTVKAHEKSLATESWQVKVIKEAVQRADSKDAKFIEHQDVVAWLRTWGSKKDGIQSLIPSP